MEKMERRSSRILPLRTPQLEAKKDKKKKTEGKWLVRQEEDQDNAVSWKPNEKSFSRMKE